MFADGLGAELATARKTGVPLERDLDAEVTDLVWAHFVQQHALKAYGARQVGWKIGATSPQARQNMQADAPFFGPLTEPDVYTSGVTLDVPAGVRGAECEFAFHMARAYPEKGEAITYEGLLDAVASCHPAIEIVGRRTVGAGLPLVRSAVADFGLNIAFVSGPAIAGWREADLAGATVIGSVDGAETNRGTGANVYGDPRRALLWLAEELPDHGRRFEAGDWISTGTALGLVPVKAGTLVAGDYGALGTVSVRFA